MTQQTIPRDIRMVLPSGWCNIPLTEPQPREAAVRKLVAQRFAGIDDQPHVRRTVEAELLGVAEAAAESGGFQMHLSTDVVDDTPLAASLVVRVAEDLLGDTAEPDQAQLAAVLRRIGDGEVRMIGFPAGQAVVRRREVVLKGSNPQEQIRNTQLEAYFALPGTSSTWIVLVFSTPLEPLADAMVELFCAITSTVEWI